MSRIGKKTIDIPVDVLVTIDDRKIGTKGKYGSLEKSFENYIQIERNENKLNIIKLNDTNWKYGKCTLHWKIKKRRSF